MKKPKPMFPTYTPCSKPTPEQSTEVSSRINRPKIVLNAKSFDVKPSVRFLKDGEEENVENKKIPSLKLTSLKPDLRP